MFQLQKALRERIACPKDTSLMDPVLLRQKNTTLEAAGLQWLGFRLPGLRIEIYFFYKFVENGPYSIGIHGHNHWEVTRVVSGSAEYEIQTDEKGIRLAPGPDRVLIIPPHMVHRWEMNDGPLVLNSWQIRMNAEDEMGEVLLSRLKQRAVESRFLIDAPPGYIHSEDLVWNISSEKLPVGVLGPMVSGLARVVVGGLVGTLRPWPQELVEHDNQSASSSENLANRLKEYLESNLHHPITLVDLESHFHYSSRHLNRIFHQNFHASIGQYLRDRRFELATRWLVTTNRSIKDIALSLGFGNISHFCRYFRKRMDLSPTEYREIGSRRSESDTFVNTTKGN